MNHHPWAEDSKEERLHRVWVLDGTTKPLVNLRTTCLWKYPLVKALLLGTCLLTWNHLQKKKKNQTPIMHVRGHLGVSVLSMGFYKNIDLSDVQEVQGNKNQKT